MPIYLLRRNIQLFLELRADNAAAKTFTDTESTQYARTIVHLASEDLSPLPSQMQSYSLQIIPESQQILSCRIAYLTSNAHRRKTSVITILALALVPLLANAFVLEPRFQNTKETEGYLTIEDFREAGAYVVKQNDSWTLVYDGTEYSITEESAKDFIDGGLEVVNK